MRAAWGLSLCVSLTLVLFVLPIAQAQKTTGTVTGTVSDTSGAVVPAATVKLVNQANGASRSSMTNGQITIVPVNHQPWVKKTRAATTVPAVSESILASVEELTMFASNLYPEWMLPEVVEFVRKREVPLDRIVTHKVPLAEAPAAFKLADSATTGKIVFAWPD